MHLRHVSFPVAVFITVAMFMGYSYTMDPSYLLVGGINIIFLFVSIMNNKCNKYDKQESMTKELNSLTPEEKMDAIKKQEEVLETERQAVADFKVSALLLIGVVLLAIGTVMLITYYYC